MSYGDDRRMSRIEDAGGVEGTDFLYDGRSFLRDLGGVDRYRD